LPTLEDLLAGRGAAALADGDSATSTLAVRTPGRVGPLAAFSASASRLLESMVDRARSQLGTRYVFGGEQPGEGLDCSSFARFAMEAMGIKLPRTAAQQARLGNAVPRDRSKLLPGDLLTFGRGKSVSHVGIYLGEGRFIHASVASRKIIETTIDRNPRLFRRWQGARRLIAIDDSTKHGES
jgi:cell wall-associated NlpC family hydrolase